MKIFMSVPLSLLICLCSIGLSAQIESRLMPHFYTQFDGVVQKTLDEQNPKVTGMAIGIVSNGKIVHLKSYGYVDYQRKNRVTNSTLFRWASVSKTVTAVAALKMQEEAKVLLHTPIRNYYNGYNNPNSRAWADRITLSQLLSNSGGFAGNRTVESWYNSNGNIRRLQPIPNWKERLATYRAIRPTTRMHRDAMVDLFQEAPLAYRPGTSAIYSSYGFNLAGAVMDARLNRFNDDFTNYIRTRIVEPLGMSSFHADFTGAHKNKAVGYDEDGRQYKEYELVSHKIPAGGFISNIVDMTRFVKGLTTGALLNQNSYGEMQKEQIRFTGSRGRYGYGLYVRTGKNNVPYYYHGGDQDQTRTMILYVPSKRMGVAIMCNSKTLSNAERRELAKDLLKVIGGPF